MTVFSQLIDGYIAATNAWQPAGASSRGFHEYDGRLGDRSSGAVDERMASVRGFLQSARQIDRTALSGHEPYDLDLLERRLKCELT